MRIIKKGMTDKAWPRTMIVRCCLSTLSVDPDDIKTDRDYTGDLNGYYVDCPVCGGQPTITSATKADADRWKRSQQVPAP